MGFLPPHDVAQGLIVIMNVFLFMLNFRGSFQINGVCLKGWAFKHTWVWSMTSEHCGAAGLIVLLETNISVCDLCSITHYKFCFEAWWNVAVYNCVWHLFFVIELKKECKIENILDRMYKVTLLVAICDKAVCWQEWNAPVEFEGCVCDLWPYLSQDCVCMRQMFKLCGRNSPLPDLNSRHHVPGPSWFSFDCNMTQGY